MILKCVENIKIHRYILKKWGNYMKYGRVEIDLRAVGA